MTSQNTLKKLFISQNEKTGINSFAETNCWGDNDGLNPSLVEKENVLWKDASSSR